MSQLDKIRVKAQFHANQERRAMAILNLNPYGPLYVVREWDDRMAGTRTLVEKVEPEA